MTSCGCFRAQLRRSALTPQTDQLCRKKGRVRSVRTECSVRDARRGTGGDGNRGIGAARRSQRRMPCDHGFAHKSSPARRGHRGKVSVSNLVQSQSATLNVAKRSGSHRLSARTSSQDDPLALPVHDLCFVSLSKHPSWVLEKFRHRTTALILL